MTAKHTAAKRAARAAATTGSVKVRHTARGITIRATGAAAQALVSAVRKTLDATPGTPYTTVHFVDDGQDVLEWDLDADRRVVASRPYQSAFWIGYQVIGSIHPGKQLEIRSALASSLRRFIHPVAAIVEGWR